MLSCDCWAGNGIGFLNYNVNSGIAFYNYDFGGLDHESYGPLDLYFQNYNPADLNQENYKPPELDFQNYNPEDLYRKNDGPQDRVFYDYNPVHLDLENVTWKATWYVNSTFHQISLQSSPTIINLLLVYFPLIFLPIVNSHPQASLRGRPLILPRYLSSRLFLTPRRSIE